MDKPQTQLQYHDPHNTLELVACELVRILGIAAGLGAIPLLRDRPLPFWIVEAAAGAVVMAVGLSFRARRARLHKPPTPTPGLLHRLLAFLRGLPAIFRSFLSGLKRLPGLLRRLADGLSRAWAWVRAHLPGHRKPAPGPLIPAAPTVEEPPPSSPAAPTHTAAPVLPPAPAAALPARPRVLLPYLTLATGLFLFLPAILVAVLLPARIPNLDQIAIYFSAPALLVWLLGEIPYLVPKIVAKPWDIPILSGVLKSALQALGAVLVFVFLALVIGQEQHPGLLYGGLGLALVGLALGYHSEAGERRRQQTRPPSLHPAEQDETAG
jgi:hypothetical protein